MPTGSAAETLRRWVRPLCPELPVSGVAGTGSCAVLDWAASGAMALTGQARRAPVASPAGAFALLAAAARLLPAADGWCAVTLSRPEDAASVPAIVGGADVTDPWQALEAAARHRPAGELAAQAQLLGVPAARLPHRVRPAASPWRHTRISAARPGARLTGALVVDLSAMWAGPLCAHLLGLAGA